MPARREWTAAELAARLERRREQTRLAVQRHRARRRGPVSITVSTTSLPETVSLTPLDVSLTPLPLQTTPSPARLAASPPPPLERLTALLTPYATRGYRHDAAYLERLLAVYTQVDLELEVAAALDWLELPCHAKRVCSKAFLTNWLKKADTDRQARAHQMASLPARPSGTNGQYAPPAAFQRQPDPPGLVPLLKPLERIAGEELRQAMQARAAMPLDEKLALARSAGK